MTLISPLIKEGVDMMLKISSGLPDIVGDEDRLIQVDVDLGRLALTLTCSLQPSGLRKQ